LAAVLTLGAAACGDLDNVTTVHDLRVLGVKCDPAGFLVDVDMPGTMPGDMPGSTPDSAWQARITALVVDPLAPNQMLEVSAVGCPDYIDAITSATLQGSKLCPPASATSQIPDPLGPALTTTPIVPADMPKQYGSIALNDVEYQPTLPAFGLTADQLHTFFTLGQTNIDAVENSIKNNRALGLAAIVNLDFTINGEHASAIKRVVYWPLLQPGQPVNTNPTLDAIRLYRHRDDATGNPIDEIDQVNEPIPTVSISAGDKLYVDPDYLAHAVDKDYLLNVLNLDPGEFEPKTIARELIRFQFYATAGTFSPAEQMSELDPALSGGTLHTDSEYAPPKLEELPADGKVTIYIVTHDERAGTDWMSRTIHVVP